jgi:hypothetical protein
MSYKSQVIKGLEGTRDCAIENARDLYFDKHEEMYPQKRWDYIDTGREHVWFKVLEDSRKIQAVIDALNALDEEWVKELAQDFVGVK